MHVVLFVRMRRWTLRNYLAARHLCNLLDATVKPCCITKNSFQILCPFGCTVHTRCVHLLVRAGLDRYQKHSFIGTVGIGPFNCWSRCNPLLRDRTVFKLSIVELSKSWITEWYQNSLNCLFTGDRGCDRSTHRIDMLDELQIVTVEHFFIFQSDFVHLQSEEG
jgi:hypothetical protein